MKTLLPLACLLFASPAFASDAPTTVSLTPAQARAVMCRGPVATIPDDDPGLPLIPDKVDLAFWRGETCGLEERGEWIEDRAADPLGGLSRDELERRIATLEMLVCPNGVNDWDGESRPSCD